MLYLDLPAWCLVFTARRYASAKYAIAVCLSDHSAVLYQHG